MANEWVLSLRSLLLGCWVPGWRLGTCAIGKAMRAQTTARDTQREYKVGRVV